MPLFQIGYRRYEGRRTRLGLRWLPITVAGLTIAWRSKLLRRGIFVAYLPFLYFIPIFFFVGRLSDPDFDPSGPIGEIARGLVPREVLHLIKEDPTSTRTAIWSILFATLTVRFQLLLAGLVAAIVGPPLISNDLRTRAFLIYFARPLSSLDYVLGKAGTLVVLLAAVTLLPSLLLYVISILFSPSIATVVHTAPIAWAIVRSGLVLIVPTTILVLLLSSLTTQARFATVAWVLVCLFGFIAHHTLAETPSLRDAKWTFLLSYPETVLAAQLSAFDVPGRLSQLPEMPITTRLASGLSTTDSNSMALVALICLSCAATVLLLRRVDAPTRI